MLKLQKAQILELVGMLWLIAICTLSFNASWQFLVLQLI